VNVPVFPVLFVPFLSFLQDVATIAKAKNSRIESVLIV